jgi:hypothetical protein
MPGNSHQDLWKSQEEESMELADHDVRDKARKHEKEREIVRWVVLGLIPFFLAAYIYNLVQMAGAPWLMLGQSLGLATFACIAWAVIRSKTDRNAPAEPCVDFLRRLFQAKLRGSLWIRRCMLLLIPAVLASWWGGGPELGAKAFGVRDPSLLNALRGPAPLIVMGVLIALVWLAFREHERRIRRELEKLA